MDENLYKENILDHYHHPRNKREIENPTLKAEGLNANCGDELMLYLKIENDKVADVSFTGTGCAVSQAATSMLTEKIKGEDLSRVKMLTPGDIYNMLGIHVSPARTNCALLGYEALSKAIKNE